MSFSFGNAGGGNAPAPALGGFSFGSAASGSNTPASPVAQTFGGTSAPASGGFGASPAPATGLAVASTAAPSLGGNVPTQQQPTSSQQRAAPTVRVPDYESIFSGQSLWNEIKPLAAAALESNALKAQELLHVVVHKHRETLAQPKVVKFSPANMQLRQRLYQQPIVVCNGQEASLTHSILQQIISISDDLRVSEEVALCLYAKTSPHDARREIQALLQPQYTQQTEHRANTADEEIGRVARDLYFYESKLQMKTLLLLFQYRLNDPLGLIIKATDALLQSGLVNHLIQCIRDYTQLMDGMLHELSCSSTRNPSFTEIMFDFCVDERQTATQILFFVAYHVQLHGQEVATMIDLVRDLSNKLPILDPFENVPSPYQNSNEMAMQSLLMSPSVQKEKDPIEWQKELVEQTKRSGLPQLLRCVSICVTAVLASLDAHSELYDRSTHSINTFGNGNSMLPPGSTNTQGLQAFHGKLSRQAESQWSRPDILGLLMGGYSLLLRASPSSLSSPRGGPMSPGTKGGGIDVRKSWKECIEATTKLRSLTFARLGLIPALQAPFDQLPECVPCEFFLSVLTNFASQYFDVIMRSGDAPISRDKWEQDAAEDLRLRVAYRDENNQFVTWAGTNTVVAEKLPSSVDPLSRPDCMDDVIAFVVAVCDLGSSYACSFWSRDEAATESSSDETVSRFTTSEALQELERQQEDDSTLRPGYLSLLAALARAHDSSLGENGASAINRMMSNPSGTETWATLLDVLRYFIQELDPRAARGVQSGAAAMSAVSSSYYYDDSGYSGSEPSAYGMSQRASKTQSESVQVKELGESNSYLALSLLELMSNVATKSAEGRVAILSTIIPIRGPRGNEIVGHDSALMILFNLSSQALSPEVRGAVFSTIACLLCTTGCSEEDIVTLQEWGLKAWEILEGSQILPLFIFEQFRTASATPRDADVLSGIAFPPSSTSMVVEKPGKSWISANKVYSIVFEMEFIESCLGIYPSTEGFLRLLRSLFEVAGSPSDLGKSWRARTGCSPYIEYVTKLVLPRAMGHFSSLGPLPFRNAISRNRLVSLALDVADVVLTHYAIPEIHEPTQSPMNEKDITRVHSDMLRVSEDKFGRLSILSSLVKKPSVGDMHVICDELGLRTDATSSMDRGQGYAFQSESMIPSLSAPASPGLTVILEVLSSAGGELFNSVMPVVINFDQTIRSWNEIDMTSLTMALFNATPPTFTSAKSGSRTSSTASLKCSLLKPLWQAYEAETYSAAALWSEQCVLKALRILCSSVIREISLQNALESLHGRQALIPVLRFEEKGRKPSLLQTFDLHVRSLSDLLLSWNGGANFLYSITRLIGYCSNNDTSDVDIATSAVILCTYLDRTRSSTKSSVAGDAFRLINDRQETARAIASRLLRSSRRSFTKKRDRELIYLILNYFVTDLRRGWNRKDSLVFMALGLSNLNGDWRLQMPVATSIETCFDAIMYLLRDSVFVLSPKTSFLASICHEIIFRMYQIGENNSSVLDSLFVAQKLRSIDFWRQNLYKLVGSLVDDNGTHTRDEHGLHAMAWSLKSLATELRVFGMSPFGPKHPVWYDDLMSLLFRPPYDLLHQIVLHLPIEKIQVESRSKVSAKAVQRCKRQLHGAPEVFLGFEVVDFDSLADVTTDVPGTDEYDALRAWTTQMNHFIRNDCATAHLSKSIYMLLLSHNAVTRHWESNIAAVDMDGQRFLQSVLDKITSLPIHQRRTNMDEIYYTNATRSLAHVALEASTAAVNEENFAADETFNMFSSAIVLSGRRGYSIDGGESRMDERTTLLASALCVQMCGRHQVYKATSIDWTDAAIVLAPLACGFVIDEPRIGCIIARACLCRLLDINAAREDWNSDIAFMKCVFMDSENPLQQKALLQRLMDSIAQHDPDVSTLVQKIAFAPSGAQLLHSSGVFDALDAAADKLVSDVSKAVASFGRSGYGAEMVIPPFLVGHLSLILSMLLVTLEDVSRSYEMACRSAAILHRYAPFLERALSRFPMDDDVLHTTLRCLVEIKSVFQSYKRVGVIHSYKNEVASLQGSPDFLKSLEKTSLNVLMHIAENPLPRHLIAVLPRFGSSDPACDAYFGKFSVKDGECWWDGLKFNSHSDKEFLHYAVYGADILRTGLALMDTQMWPCLTDIDQLARAICRCVESIRVVENKCESMDMETSELKERGRLRVYLADSVSQMTIACLSLLHRVRRFDYPPSQHDMVQKMRNTIRLALDMCRIDIAPLLSPQGDENQPGTASIRILACALRKELDEQENSE